MEQLTCFTITFATRHVFRNIWMRCCIIFSHCFPCSAGRQAGRHASGSIKRTHLLCFGCWKLMLTSSNSVHLSTSISCRRKGAGREKFRVYQKWPIFIYESEVHDAAVGTWNQERDIHSVIRCIQDSALCYLLRDNMLEGEEEKKRSIVDSIGDKCRS